MTTVYINGKNSVALNDKDFIAQGGEGAIFGKGSLIFKIYHDPQKVISEAKVQELSLLDKPNILRPLDMLSNKTGQHIGFTMSWIKDTVAICKLFTNDFRDRIGFSNDNTIKLVETLQKDINFIHNKQCLIVDLNEYNFLVSTKDYTLPYFIDVNSYQTPSYPAEALMESVKDWHTKGFSILTDWFSFAIISFQLFTGIHPYKGGHPKFKNHDFVGRMKANISVLNKDVKVPTIIRDFNLIPKNYASWYYEVLEKGRRVEPPTIAGMSQQAPIKTIKVSSTNTFIIKEVASFSSKILGHFTVAQSNYDHIILDKQLILGVDKTARTYQLHNKDSEIFYDKNNKLIEAYTEKNEPILYELNTGNSYNSGLTSYGMMIVDNELIVHTMDYIRNIQLIGDRIIQQTYQEVSTNATTLYRKIFIMDALGTPCAFIPYKYNHNVCYLVSLLPKLKGYRIVDARVNDKLVMIVASKYSSVYDRFVYTINNNTLQFVEEMKDVGLYSLNFTVLQTGVCLFINENEELELFRLSQPLHKTVLKDTAISSDMILSNHGAKAMFYKENKLFEFSLK